jgi:sugar/nucleoside kinase (ribokinase family)
MKKSILAVGSVAFDSIKTPSGFVEKALGGSANYFSIAASFYNPLSIVGVVGEDFPKEHLQWLSTRGINVEGVKTQAGKTFHWSGSYVSNLNEAQTLATDLNVFEHFNPVLDEQQKNSPIVFLANIDPTLQLSVLNQVKSPQFIAMDTMNFWITGKPTELKEVIQRVDLLSINETEACMLSGKDNLIKAAQKILTMGPRVLVIKRGEYGATLFTQNTIYMAPSYPTDTVVDPTGAGDSFAGALIGYLTSENIHRDLATENPKKWDNLLKKAVLRGCIMASFTIEDFSFNRLKSVTSHDLETRFQKLISMITLQDL